MTGEQRGNSSWASKNLGVMVNKWSMTRIEGCCRWFAHHLRLTSGRIQNKETCWEVTNIKWGRNMIKLMSWAWDCNVYIYIFIYIYIYIHIYTYIYRYHTYNSMCRSICMQHAYISIFCIQLFTRKNCFTRAHVREYSEMKR